MIISILLHLYQPPQQHAFVFSEVFQTCYLPLLKLIKAKKDFNVVLNTPLSFLEWVEKNNGEDFLKELKIKTKIKFKTNVAKLKGKPDIVFVKEKVCVFLDSDFWHGWQFGRWKNLMKNDFWVDKITNNRLRDRKTTGYLRKRGWRVLRFWEHSIKNNPNRVFEKIIQTLET